MNGKQYNHQAPDSVKLVEKAIANNPECKLGILHQFGYAYTNHGECSDCDQPELIVLMTPQHGDSQNTWYGHVLCREMEEGELAWIAVLVRSTAQYIDDYTVQGVFRCFKSFIEEGGQWEPPFAQLDDDIKSMHDTFDEAVIALADKINRFELALRQHVEEKCVRVVESNGRVVYFPSPEEPENSFSDFCYCEIYRIGGRTDYSKEPPVDGRIGAKTELPNDE